MNEFETTVLSDLATLKAQMRALVGNGQPGRIRQLEDSVERHERWITRASGIGAFVAVLIALLHVAIDYFRR